MKVKATKSADRPKGSDKKPQRPKRQREQREEKPKTDEVKKPERTGPYDDPHRRPA